MMDMIERVAQAIAKAALDDGDGTFDVHALTEEIYDGFLLQARAAIEAMREPTPKMLGAAGKALSPGRRPTEEWVSVNAKHGIRYRAMIDEALSRPTPGSKEKKPVDAD